MDCSWACDPLLYFYVGWVLYRYIWIMKRVFERIPALVSWSIIIIPIILSFVYPSASAYFLVGFVFLWFFRTVEYCFFLVHSYFTYKKHLKYDFTSALNSWDSGNGLSKKEKKSRELQAEHDIYMSSDRIKHIVVIATCGEPIEVLRDTIDSVKESNFYMGRVNIVLATEARMEPESSHIAKSLQKEYEGVFAGFYTFAHPDGIPGEVRGKGGNITHSGREITKILEEKGEDIGDYLVTTLDADNRFHPEYLNSLTLKYIQTPDRQHCSYQPLPLFFNNIWDVPLINRMIAIAGGFWHMVESSRPYRLHNFSSHAQPLKALKEMDYWATDTIVEDGHQYWRSYFHFKGEYHVEPLFIPIYQDAVMNHNYKKSITAQYKQIRRWAWGASDIPYVLIEWGKYFSRMPFFETLINFIRLFESHIFWATGAIVITLATPIPGLLNPEYALTGYPIAISGILSFFFNGAILGIFLMILFSFLTLPKPPKKIRYVHLLFQWIFIPIMTVFFGAIPALEAQTRLFLGKYLGFNVTEKIRKKEE